MARNELHFVGSVPMPDATAVMTLLGQRFGRHLRRLPDGETDARLTWLGWQDGVFAANPALEAVPAEEDWRKGTATFDKSFQYRLRAGVDAATLQFGNLGYAEHALDSYARFRALKEAGTVPAGVRFMVAIPSPYNIISWFVTPEHRARIEPLYERALLAEVAQLCAAVPANDLSIQWDCAHDVQALDGARQAWFTDVAAGVAERLARLGNAIPAGVELGYHLCYGSFGGKHFVEPRDLGTMVDLTNAFTAQLRRTIEFVHMPVPIEWTEARYYEPLARLTERPGMALYLGLLHDQDGAAGAEVRIHLARRYRADFGLAMECGFGRRKPATLPGVFAVHAAGLRLQCAHCDPRIDGD